MTDDLTDIQLPDLGEFITWLESRPEAQEIALDLSLHSDRGDYAQVAIPRGRTTTGSLARLLRRSLGLTMTGYKGGEYTVHERCSVFIAGYGEMGPRLGIVNDDQIVTVGDGWDVR